MVQWVAHLALDQGLEFVLSPLSDSGYSIWIKKTSP